MLNYSPKLKLLLFNIISLVCDTLAPAVWKLADAAQEEVFWLPMLWKSLAGAHEVHSPVFPFLF
jgi:hypothetical protein